MKILFLSFFNSQNKIKKQNLCLKNKNEATQQQ